MNTGLTGVLLFLVQQPDIEKKLDEAPDDGYAIGVLIGSFLPFILLVIAAYMIYRYQKKRLNDNQFD